MDSGKPETNSSPRVNASGGTSDVETLPSTSDYERNRENLRNSQTQGLSRPIGGVDVKRAEEDFEELSKQLSAISQESRRASRRLSHRGADEKSGIDVESSSTVDEPWDLESTLRGNRAAEIDAGIKPKSIGTFHYCIKPACLCINCVFDQGSSGKISLFAGWVARGMLSRPFPMLLSTSSMSPEPL